MTGVSEINYNGWPHCVELKNDKIKLIVTTDVGPRIIHCGAADSDINLFYQNTEQQGKVNSEEWLLYGGHRLWHSPQMGFRPNQPDNKKVDYSISENSLKLCCPEEAATKVQKEIIITLDPDRPAAKILHRIYNRGQWPIRLAAWALTVMAETGTEIFPIPKEDTWFMPNYAISFWPWTKPNDHRFTLGEKYMLLKHDPNDKRWFKIGYRNTEGWCAYLVNGFMFVKLYSPIKGEEYPDYGSTFETYTDSAFLELESLGPLKTLEPGGYTEHTEEWHIFKNVYLSQSAPDIESEIDEKIIKLINTITGK